MAIQLADAKTIGGSIGQMREHLRKADTAWLQGDEHEAMDLIDFVVSVGLREIARQRQQKGTRNADSRQR